MAEIITEDVIKKLEPSPEVDTEEKEESQPESDFKVSPIKFNEVIGMGKEKKLIAERLESIISDRNMGIWKRLKFRGTMNCLLYGAPGAGKSLLFRAASGQFNVPMMDVKSTDILDKFVGSGGRNIVELFDKIKQNEPCMAFFDEIDALARARDNTQDTSSEYRNTLSAFLKQTELLHMEKKKIFLAAATNTVWDLDLAIIRPGRFDYLIYVKPPSLGDRIGIFKLYLDANLKKEEKYTKRINWWILGLASIGCSGTDIEKMVEAARYLAKERAKYYHLPEEKVFIEMQDIGKVMRSKEHSGNSLDTWYLRMYSSYVAKAKIKKVGKGKNQMQQVQEGGRMSDGDRKSFDEFVKDVEGYRHRRWAVLLVRWIFRMPILM